jgi:hypothetical protein
MKSTDEIIDEVRRVREAYAERFDFDVKRMVEDLQQKEAASTGPRAEPLPGKVPRE